MTHEPASELLLRCGRQEFVRLLITVCSESDVPRNCTRRVSCQSPIAMDQQQQAPRRAPPFRTTHTAVGVTVHGRNDGCKWEKKCEIGWLAGGCSSQFTWSVLQPAREHAWPECLTQMIKKDCHFNQTAREAC